MEAKEYLISIGIDDRIVNKEDLPEYWKTISTLMEEYYQIKTNLNKENDKIIK